MKDSIIRFGSLTARLHAERQRGEDVARIFGTSLVPATTDLLERVDVEIFLSEPATSDWPGRPAVPGDGMVLCRAADRTEIHTEVVAAALDLTTEPKRAVVDVLESGTPHFDLCVHLAVVFHKLLFLLDRVILHAAAVRYDDRVSLFVGERGAGKSTIALRLTRAGGAVLGEDHLLLRRNGGGFLVSGCDDRWRLDEKTERHFFEEPLPITPMDFAGRLKKELVDRDRECAQPFTDARPDLLFFARPGARFCVTALSRGAALLKLLEAAGRMQRFVDGTDRGRFLAMMSDFVQTVTPYDLELSHDLGELDALVSMLGEGTPVTAA